MSLSRSFISICLQHSRQSRNTVLRAPWVEITCLSDISSSGLVPHDVSSVIGSLPGDTDGSDKSDDSDHSYDLLLRDTDCAWSIIYIQVTPPMVYLLQHFWLFFSFFNSGWNPSQALLKIGWNWAPSLHCSSFIWQVNILYQLIPFNWLIFLPFPIFQLSNGSFYPTI